MSLNNWKGQVPAYKEISLMFEQKPFCHRQVDGGRINFWNAPWGFDSLKYHQSQKSAETADFFLGSQISEILTIP